MWVRRCCGLLLLGAVGAGSIVTFAGDAEPDAPPTDAAWIYEPDPTRSELVLEGSTWVSASPRHEIRLTLIDARARQTYLLKTLDCETDPFAAPPGKTDRFMSFLLRLVNPGKVGFAYNPVATPLMTNSKEIKKPLAMTDLSFEFKIAGGELPPAYERIAPALLQYSGTLEPEQALHGLLVYKMVKPNTKRFTVELQLVLPSGDVIKFKAPYRKVNTKKKGKRGKKGQRDG